MLPKQSIDLEVGERNVMSVEVPSFEFIASESADSDIYSYGFVGTSGELDDSVAAVQNVLLVLPDDRQEAAIRQDFARLGLDEAALALPARKLSGGQKRRTALLRLMHMLFH